MLIFSEFYDWSNFIFLMDEEKLMMHCIKKEDMGKEGVKKSGEKLWMDPPKGQLISNFEILNQKLKYSSLKWVK